MLKGFFGAISDEPVTYVNAPQLAKEHGVEVREVSSRHVGRLRQPAHDLAAAGTRSAARSRARSEQRIVNIDDTPFDVPPADHMVMVTNDDRPGVIGTVGTLLGNAGVNIADMDVSRVDRFGHRGHADRPDAAGPRPRSSTRSAPPPASSASPASPPDSPRARSSHVHWRSVPLSATPRDFRAAWEGGSGGRRREAAVRSASARAASAKSSPPLA